MFHSAKLRLTLSYLALIMLVSVSFTALLYRTSSSEINRGLSRQSMFMHQFNPFDDQFEQLRLDAISTARARLFFQLFLVNVGMLTAGSFFSYWLATRTLNPIEEAHNAQVRFTSDAAHELRTPLTAMKTEIEVNLRDKNLTIAEARAVMESNIEEIAKLDALTNGLLRLAKNGSKPAKVTTFNIYLAANDARKRFRNNAEKKQISVVNKIPKVLKLSADKDQIVELLAILVDNAVKYGREKTTVTMDGEKIDGHIRLSVTDMGSGIEQKDIEHIFERFYRVDQSRTNSSTAGYGLGLSLAKQIVKSHSGEINVSSEVGVGSTFTVILPIA